MVPILILAPLLCPLETGCLGLREEVFSWEYQPLLYNLPGSYWRCGSWVTALDSSSPGSLSASHMQDAMQSPLLHAVKWPPPPVNDASASYRQERSQNSA